MPKINVSVFRCTIRLGILPMSFNNPTFKKVQLS